MSTRFVVSALVGVVVGVVTESPQAGFQAFSLSPGIGAAINPHLATRKARTRKPARRGKVSQAHRA